MDYIREAENKLKEYKLLERSLDNMAAEISRLKWMGAPRDTGAMKLDTLGIHGGMKENDALSIACAIAYCKETRVMSQREIQRINTNLNHISRELGREDYGDLLRLWYIGLREKDPETDIIGYRKVTVEEICEILKYSAESRRYFYDRKKDAIRKFAKAYWGVRVN